MSRPRSPISPAWLLVFSCVFGALASLSPGASAAGDKGELRPITTPMPDGSATPKGLLPPGAFYPDPGPSKAIYPPQEIPLRFNHKKHMSKDGAGMACVDCHVAAKSSAKVEDRLLPSPKVCDGCHGTNHDDLDKVKGGDEGFGNCAFCHLRYKKRDLNEVTQVVWPVANMTSNHKVHAERNIGCESCHGAVQEVELATREQLPRMKGCFGCHAMSGPGKGNARSDCETCHVKVPAGQIQVSFTAGKLLPPRWMGNLEHTADFIERHKRVAADNSQACSSCHREDFCTDCHDGRVRPRNVHANDYLSLHAVEARLDSPHCASCHQQQQFCLPCHQRAGVTMSGSQGELAHQGRFHPPRSVWSELPRTRQHHAWEAERNLSACVSCHTERDCAVCHASQSAGGRGFNPHPASFQSKCAAAARKNPRPCLVCHEGQSPGSLCK